MSRPELIIESLKARAVLAPLARPIRTASGTIPAAPLVLIDVATEQGVTGRAYLFGYTPLTLAPLCRSSCENLAPLLVRQGRRAGDARAAISSARSACSGGRAWSAWRCRASTWRCGMRWAGRGRAGVPAARRRHGADPRL